MEVDFVIAFFALICPEGKDTVGRNSEWLEKLIP